MAGDEPATARRQLRGFSSHAAQIVLTPEALAFAAHVRQAQRILVKDKAYRSTPVGGEVGRFLRSLRWSDKSQNTLDTYEIVLARLAYDHAHFQTLDEFTTEVLRDFLDEHWGDSAPATRRNRLAIVKSFFHWAVQERDLGQNPAAGSSRRRRPRSNGRPTARTSSRSCAARSRRSASRSPSSSSAGLRYARTSSGCSGSPTSTSPRAPSSSTARAARSSSCRSRSTISSATSSCTWSAVTRAEYLLFPKQDPSRPMDPASVHRWFKKALERAGLPVDGQDARASAFGRGQPVAGDRESHARAAASAPLVGRDDAGVSASDAG